MVDHAKLQSPSITRHVILITYNHRIKFEKTDFNYRIAVTTSLLHLIMTLDTLQDIVMRGLWSSKLTSTWEANGHLNNPKIG